MTPPQLNDREGFPFHMLSRVPYRPDSFKDWREGIMEELVERFHKDKPE
jgi:hypothetical protein